MESSNLTPRVQRARALAILAHGAQLYGDQPYVVHLDEVVGILIEFGHTDEDTLIAGYLHDAVEDTALTAAMVETEFGFATAEAVRFCTDEKGPSRRERKAATYKRQRRAIDALWLGQGIPEIILRGIWVKLADRLANLRKSTRDNKSLLSMYQKETESFREALIIDAADAKPDPNADMWLEYDRLLGVTL